MKKIIIPWRYKTKVWYWRLLKLFKCPETQVVWRGTLCHGIVNLRVSRSVGDDPL